MSLATEKLIFRHIFADNRGVLVKVEGYTVSGLMELLGRRESAVRQALSAYGIKPVVPEFIYPVETLEILRNAPPRGRPKKKREEQPPEDESQKADSG